jgi:two-component system response regulator YesN
MILLIVNDAELETLTIKKEVRWDECGIEEVFTAFCVEEAKKVILSHPIDILLCDIEMPGENGLALIRWINESKYDIDSILLTCHADFVYAKEAISLNCQDYLLLPAQYDEIRDCVLKTCKRREQRLLDRQLQLYGQNWLKDKNEAVQEQCCSGKSSKEIVENCTRYILNNISDADLSVSVLADHFYLNSIYLNRIFKKETGINLSHWIIQERMKLAAHLLETSNAAAVNVALEVGYPNYPYFSTTFKKYYHCTPTQYAQEKHQ